MDLDIIIADDHTLVLEGLMNLVAQHPGVRDIVLAQSGSQLLSHLSARTFHICIVDLELPDIDGFELIRRVRQKARGTQIIVSTMHEEIWTVNRLKQEKVEGVVFKSSAGEHILSAIDEVVQGRSYYCPRFRQLCQEKEKMSTGVEMPDMAPTPRELDILKAIARGRNTHEISEELFISENTVEWHRKNLMLKFGARNAADLVIKALSKGFLTIPL